MALMEFDQSPEISLWALGTKRGRGLQGGTIPRVEASLRGVDARQGLAAYQRVCGFPESAVLPLTWPQVLAGPLHMAVFCHADFPLSPMGIVHVSNGIRQERPILSDEPLDLRVSVEGHRAARKGIEFDLITEVRSGADRIWSARTTILSRAEKGDGQKRERAPEPALDVGRSTAWALGEDLGRRYAAVSGDNNPIHLHPLTAKLFGFPRHIIHGMWSLARCLAEVDDDLSDEPISVEVGFRRPILLPSTVLFESGRLQTGLGFRVRDPRGRDCLVGRVD
ncbi:MAG: hypothetical protein GY913_14600 [Proteobacteria bacterium]|nr:hypothetical protein [Pseudomonadota bacterium]MCP4918140.1 hypothetical protein [Pseudomonadota bacterium]